jgi:hypothetical protein
VEFEQDTGARGIVALSRPGELCVDQTTIEDVDRSIAAILRAASS